MDADDAADAEVMAAAMGFSSFGAQKPPNKKRKYNLHADASTAADRQKPATGTGANSAPLGSRPAPPANTDEIQLVDDDDDDDEEEGDDADGNTVATAVAEAGDISTQDAYAASLPQRPAAGTGFVGDFAGNNQSHGHGGGKQHNKLWYENYYDHLSNENPWARLEKKLGLQPRGAWIVREPTQATPV
jgi:hypothetical protein